MYYVVCYVAKIIIFEDFTLLRNTLKYSWFSGRFYTLVLIDNF